MHARFHDFLKSPDFLTATLKQIGTEELMVSSLAMADTLAKLLIENWLRVESLSKRLAITPQTKDEDPDCK